MKKHNRAMLQNTIAVIFDFDDTLTDDTITGLLSENDINVVRFWKEVDKLVSQGWDPPLAYMKRMIDLVNEGDLSLSNEDLRAFGIKLEFYPGIPEMLDELRDLISSDPLYGDVGINIEYYIISGGLQEIIENSKIRHYLRDFWGSTFYTDPRTGNIFPKASMTFTEKTRCLFQINKGLVGPRYKGKPGRVNEPKLEGKRPIPFPHMIYVGDGLTDIACMSILDEFDEITFGVFDREKLERPEYKARSWLLLKREVPLFAARYERTNRLRTEIEWAVLRICRRIVGL